MYTIVLRPHFANVQVFPFTTTVSAPRKHLLNVVNPFQKILLSKSSELWRAHLRSVLKSHGSPRLYSSIMLDALLQTNHTALLRPHISNQTSNQCAYLLLYIPKTLLKKSARLSDWQRLEFSLYKRFKNQCTMLSLY
jgi:hypothetical protein